MVITVGKDTVKFLSQLLHMISWYRDMFYDFLTSFVFYTILKQLDHKFAVMFCEHDVQNLWFILE
jgi:hypothetical protein